jgi:tetratricopeptide (TPR) repeat protein
MPASPQRFPTRSSSKTLRLAASLFQLSAISAFSAMSAAPALAQAPPSAEPALLEERRVTAVDTLLHFDRDGLSQWASGNATPENLGAADFEVLVDGVARPVVEVEAFEHLDAASRSPWTQLIYIDCRMISTGGLRAATALLHRELPRLVELGPIEVVLADPAPRPLYAPTTDRGELERVLSRLALDTECRDTPQALRDELLRLRSESKGSESKGSESKKVTAPVPGDAPPGESSPDEAPAPSPARLAAEARLAENEAIRLSTLALLQTLTQDPRAGGAQKLVYLLHGGFDRRAAEFYAAAGAPAQEDPAENVPSIGPLLLAKLIAAYGWTVMPVSEQAFEASLRGAEVGRFLVDMKTGEQLDADNRRLTDRPAVTNLDDDQRKQSLLAGIRATLREKRDPKRAESYLELGQALAGQKKWPEAEDAFRKAIYHFDGAKKHQDQEAKAWLGVGRAKAGQGDLASGRAATEKAVQLDPGLVSRGEAETVGLRDRGLFLAGLAEATLGRAVAGEQQLRQGLAELGIRLRLTYQIAGDPDGRLMPLEIRHKGGQRVKALPWARFGTPEDVAAARLLASLDDELGAAESEGGLDLAAFAATRGKLLDLGQLAGDGPATIRVSILRGDPEGAQKIEHHIYPIAPLAERDLAASRVAYAGYLALLVENLDTGEWGIRTFDDE